MSSSVVINSVTSNLDGYTATVVTSGVPTGPLSFYIGRANEPTLAFPAVFSGTGPYTVVFPHHDAWYVWAYDNNGLSYQGVPEIIGLTTLLELHELGGLLRDIIWRNKSMIEVAMRHASYPNVTLKQVVYGSSTAITAYPAVQVMEPSFSDDWAFIAYGKDYNWKATIKCIDVHQDEDSEAALITTMTQAVAKLILGNPVYNTITLPGGTSITNCIAGFVDVDERELGEQYEATGTINWSGNSIAQDSGGM